MSKLLCIVCFYCMTLPALCQVTSKWQVGTITDVRRHPSAASTSSDVVRYDVSLKVQDTVYVVLYTPPLGMNTVKYASGRDLLVLVGKETITYNDMLGQSLEVPIVNRRPAAAAKPSK